MDRESCSRDVMQPSLFFGPEDWGFPALSLLAILLPELSDVMARGIVVIIYYDTVCGIESPASTDRKIAHL